MSIVNETGAHHFTLTALGTERPELDCMLKSEVVKKSENWAVQLTDFLVSRQPPLNPNINSEFMRILPMEPDDAAKDLIMFGIYGSDYIFTPKNCTSVISLYQQLNAFCRNMSQKFYSYGLGNYVDLLLPNAVIQEFYTAQQHADTQVQYNVDTTDFLNVSLDSDLKLSFVLGKHFANNFYISLSDYASGIVGLPQQIFHVEPNHTSTLNLDDIDDVPIYAMENRAVITDNVFQVRIQSEESIKNFDERMSIDIVSTFPVARKVTVFNGQPQEEYLLGRFDLSSFRKFEIINDYEQDQDIYSDPNTRVKETHHASAFNLTVGNPDYESNVLLGGAVRSVNFKIFVRYIDSKAKITSVLFPMADNYFSIKCLFSKKL